MPVGRGSGVNSVGVRESRLFKGLGRGGREGEWDGGAEEAGGNDAITLHRD